MGIGLAETQQTLLRDDLARAILVEVDGQMRTGRDVVIAAILGADEFGFSTAPLIALGCVMMRVCHLNTCPVGVATQDPELRRRFDGRPEQVMNYLFMVAEEARRMMASLGVRTVDELIGRTDLLAADEAVDHWKARGVDLRPLLVVPEDLPADAPRHRTRAPDPVLFDSIDVDLLQICRPALERAEPVASRTPDPQPEPRGRRSPVRRDRAALRRRRPSRRHRRGRLPRVGGAELRRLAGAGVTLLLEGDANDYTAKGLSGGTVVVRPPPEATFAAEENVIVGNVVLYGATAGRAFFRGLAGERFAVRNSGAVAVVEGVGDHCCEYMTGGTVVVLGPSGLNFAAGMSGGIAYVLDVDGGFRSRCNMDLVGFDEISTDEALALRRLVAEHGQRTGSAVAARLLERFEGELERFVKVMPHDYKRALEQRRAGEREPASSPAAPAGARG